MYQIGDQVIYGSHGVCRVASMEEQMVDRKRVTYLVLEPAGQQGSRYLLPMDNPVAMSRLHKVLTARELDELIHSPQIRVDCWISEENQRKQRYRELISGGDRVALMSMICTLYRHKAAQAAAGRKCHMCDDNFLRDAEKLLCSEVMAAMDLDLNQAKIYIREKLSA